MDLNKLRDEAYGIACAHGWHDVEMPDEHFLMLIVTEISEAVDADRCEKHADKDAFERDTMHALRELHLSGTSYEVYASSAFYNNVKDSVEDELADVIIRCLDLAGLRNIDLEECEYDDEDQHFKDMGFTEFAFALTQQVAGYSGGRSSLWNVIEDVYAEVTGYCRYNGINIEWHVREKMKYNQKREYKHGKAY